jgi:hypothetical protein
MQTDICLGEVYPSPLSPLANLSYDLVPVTPKPTSAVSFDFVSFCRAALLVTPHAFVQLGSKFLLPLDTTNRTSGPSMSLAFFDVFLSALVSLLVHVLTCFPRRYDALILLAYFLVMFVGLLIVLNLVSKLLLPRGIEAIPDLC